VGGVGVGIFDGFDIAGTVSEELTTRHPVAARHQRYAGEYELFMEAYRRLEPWFAKL
jgi:xylulokinase